MNVVEITTARSEIAFNDNRSQVLLVRRPAITIASAGPQGAPGPAGTGIKGDKGDQGDPGPPGDSGNVSQIIVDFGTGDDYATSTVDAAWITSASVPVCSVMAHAADHDPEDVLLERVSATVSNIIEGVGFDVHVHAPQGTWGRYVVNVKG